MDNPVFPKAVVFDLDGTLIDNSSFMVDAYFSGMLELGYEPKDRDFIRLQLGKSTFDIGRALGLKDSDLRKLDTYFWTFFGSFVSDEDKIPIVYPGVQDLLQLLHKYHIPVAICTSNKSSFARALMDKISLGSFISTFVGSDDLLDQKPSPGPVFLALKRLGFEKSSSKDSSFWFVGDTATDVLAASSAGLSSFVVPEPSRISSVKDQNPDFLFDSMVQLLDFVKPVFQ